MGETHILYTEGTEDCKPTPIRVNYIGKERIPFSQGERKLRTIPIYDESAFKWLAAIAKERVANGFDNNFLFTGLPRFGKSTGAQILAREINGDGFTQDCITFRGHEMLKHLQASPEGDASVNSYPVTISDEAGVDLLSSEWWSEFQRSLVKVYHIVGIKKHTSILVLPCLVDLTTRVREERINYWLYAWSRGYMEVARCSPNQYKHEAYWNPICGIKFNAIEGKFWDEYQNRKRIFVDEYLKEQDELQASSGRVQDIEKYRDRCITLINYIIARHGGTQKSIAEALGCGQPWISNLLKSGKKGVPPVEQI